MFFMRVYIKHLHFIIMSMNVVGLRPYVLSFATRTLSDDPSPPPPPSSAKLQTVAEFNKDFV